MGVLDVRVVNARQNERGAEYDATALIDVLRDIYGFYCPFYP